MEVWVAIAGLFAIIFEPVVRLAFDHPRKWPTFRDRVYWTCIALVLVVAIAGATFGLGFVFGSDAKKGAEILSATLAICVITLGLALLTWIADWLRQP